MRIFDAWLRDLPEQFQDKHNIKVLISAFAKQLQEIEDVFHDLNSKTDLDTATGKNLDYVGTIIPLTRKEAGELAGIGGSEPVIPDEKYRQLLRYKNLVNTNECTYYDLMEGLSLLWDVSPVHYIEDPAFPATIILTMPFLKPGGQEVTLGEVPMVKPAGVRVEFEYQIKAIVEVSSNIVCKSYDVPQCGRILCGTCPQRATVGKIVRTLVEEESNEIVKVFNAKKAGTLLCGTYPSRK